MMSKWVRTFSMITALGLGWMAGCSGGSDSGQANVIKIGSLSSMTGATNTFGTSCDAGVKLAAEERNKAGGLLGKQIQIVTADTESTADKTKTAVLQLLDNEHVVAVIGEVASSRSMAAAPTCQSRKVPMLTPASTNPQVTQYGNYIFRSCYVDDVQGKWVATYARNQLKLAKAALLVDKRQDYSVGLGKSCEENFIKLGGTIVAKEYYQSGDTDFSVPLTTIKAANPEIVFLTGYYSEVPEIVKRARELGMTQPFIGGDGWESEKTLERGGRALDGCFFTTHSDSGDPDPAVQAFVSKYKERYGKIPDAMATLGYDGARIMFEAIERAGSTEGPKIRDALAKTKDFAGVTGKITLDENRNALKPGVMMGFKDGELKMVQRMEP